LATSVTLLLFTAFTTVLAAARLGEALLVVEPLILVAEYEGVAAVTASQRVALVRRTVETQRPVAILELRHLGRLALERVVAEVARDLDPRLLTGSATLRFFPATLDGLPLVADAP
jgi:hypothetical protein